MAAGLPGELHETLQQQLGATIRGFKSIAGGCINNGGKLDTSGGSFFVKWNSAARFPGMFESEARGLNLLAAQDCIHVPVVQAQGQVGELQFIVMEFVNQGKPSRNFWEDLGRKLASLHQVTAPTFGLNHDNYIGSLPQANKQHTDWVGFFIQQRLEPQLTLLNATHRLRQNFEQLFKRLPDIFPIEPPALLHGDLWSGNLIVDSRGEPCVIDPAIYYGHREMDLAFTRLFGGFDPKFYDTYKEVLPLKPGFEERMDVCNLYPLLVHANLFGGHYIMEIEEIVTRWI